MASFYDVYTILNEARGVTQESVTHFARARDLVRDAIVALQRINDGGQLLDQAIERFGDAGAGIEEAIGRLAAFPAVFNSYMEQNGMPPLEEIQIPGEAFSVPSAPAVPEKAPQTPPPEDNKGAEAQYRSFGQDLCKKVEEMQAQDGDPESLPGYVGSGRTHHVVEVDGGANVAKVLAYDPANPDGVTLDMLQDRQDDAMEALRRTKGEDGFEQVVAVVDMNNGKGKVIVCKHAGTALSKLPREEFENISEEDFTQLIKAYNRTAEVGVRFDDWGADDNIAYDRQKGFTLLDLESYDKRPATPKRVRNFAHDVLFDRCRPTGRSAPLPKSMKTFCRSFRKVFGHEAAEDLKQEWKKQRYEVPVDV